VIGAVFLRTGTHEEEAPGAVPAAAEAGC
jgi:hypothetical protein